MKELATEFPIKAETGVRIRLAVELAMVSAIEFPTELATEFPTKKVAGVRIRFEVVLMMAILEGRTLIQAVEF